MPIRPIIVPRQIQIGSLSQGGPVSSGTTLSWTHTMEAANNSAVFVCFSYVRLNSDITSVTFGGQAMTSIVNQLVSLAAEDTEIRVYRLANPPTGDQTVTITRSHSYSAAEVGKAVAFGVFNATNPPDTDTNVATGTAASENTTASTLDTGRSILFDYVITEDVTNHVVPATQLQIAGWTVISNGTQSDIEISISLKRPNSTTAETMSRSWTGSKSYGSFIWTVSPI